jgi:hypothetical protein
MTVLRHRTRASPGAATLLSISFELRKHCRLIASVREMEKVGISLVATERTTPDYLKHFVASEIDKWAAPIKASGLTMD